ncbi:flagellum-Specific ATP synthase [Arthrobacter sp. Hiyo8]|nr:flagellum-Specific ATP synthase [Arthrobacter sp. Hiyo8]
MSGINYRPHAGRFRSALAAAAPQRVGTVTSVLGLGLEVSGLDCAVGDLVTVARRPGSTPKWSPRSVALSAACRWDG